MHDHSPPIATATRRPSIHGRNPRFNGRTESARLSSNPFTLILVHTFILIHALSRRSHLLWWLDNLPQSRSHTVTGILLKLKLHWQILIAMILGAAAGSLFGDNAVFSGTVDKVATVFMRLLRMVIVPLIFTSIVTGVAGIGDPKSLGRLGLKTLLYYLATSFFAALVGLGLVNIIQPGVGVEIPELSGERPEELDNVATSLTDVIINMVPTNPVQAAADFDILGLIFFSIFLGAAMATMQNAAGERLRSFFGAAFEAMMVMTGFVLRVLPIGVFALIAAAISKMGFGVFNQIGQYMLTIAIGLTLHTFVVLPLLFFVLTKRNPLDHYRAMAPAMAMAFSTSSSSATLPATIKCLRENVGVSNKTTSFVIPMGATINMDGTALYECAGALFIAQALGIQMSFTQQIVIVITALLVSIGAASIPSAGLVMIFIVLEAVGLTDPAAYALVGLMLAVDRPLDMYRTMVNITSDSIGAAVIGDSEGEELNYDKDSD